eukprot:IDg18031t1
MTMGCLLKTAVVTALLTTLAFAQGSCSSSNFKACTPNPEEPKSLGIQENIIGNSKDGPFTLGLKKFKNDLKELADVFEEARTIVNKSLRDEKGEACNKRNNLWTPEVQKMTKQ